MYKILVALWNGRLYQIRQPEEPLYQKRLGMHEFLAHEQDYVAVPKDLVIQCLLVHHL